MTDAERAEIARRTIAAWNDGDLDAMLAVLDPDFEMRLAGAFLGLEREYHGHNGYREFWTEFRGMWTKIEVSLDGLSHIDTVVLGDARFKGVGREELEVDMPFYACLQIPGQRILAWSNFTEREQAVEAARSLSGLKTEGGG